MTHSESINVISGEIKDFTFNLVEEKVLPGGGIPGFPYESIIIGLIIGAIILWTIQRKSYNKHGLNGEKIG
jgi:hypothetical protein